VVVVVRTDVTLSEQVDADLVGAMKARDAVRLSTLRLLKAAVKNAEVEKRAPLNDEEYGAVLQRQAKIRREAIAEYERGNRPDLAAQEHAELAILEDYLPEQLDDSAILLAVDEAIATSGAAGAADLGKVMALVMPKLRGRAEGQRVNRLVRERLAGR
jgi:uncharacterized protein YqeY